MPYKQLDRKKLNVKPLSERPNKVNIKTDYIPVDVRALSKKLRELRASRVKQFSFEGDMPQDWKDWWEDEIADYAEKKALEPKEKVEINKD